MTDPVAAPSAAGLSSLIPLTTKVAALQMSPGEDQFRPKRVIRVMIVEDDDATAYLIERAFRERSARVDWELSFSQDGEHALGYLFRRGEHESAARPDIVLLDWNLPRISGHEVLRALKSNDGLRTVPVLVFSSAQDDKVVDTAYKDHANGYIYKPSDLETFYTVIESIEKFWVHTARLPPNSTMRTRCVQAAEHTLCGHVQHVPDGPTSGLTRSVLAKS